MLPNIRDAMLKAGIECDGRIICDGRIHRFKVAGSRKENGWYVFHRDGDKVFGTFGDWKSGLSVTLGSQTRRISELREQCRIDAGERAEDAARRARLEWDQASSADVEELREPHPYLVKKGVAPHGRTFGLKRRGDLLLVPMRRGAEIVGLQSIAPDGTKRFTPGCKKLGASFLIEAPGKAVVLCEGYATGASIHLATSLAVLVAFDCGNLLQAASVYGGKVEKWIVAADNDLNTPGNPGLSKAREAAKALRGRVAVPSCGGTDFNDMHCERGLEPVADEIYACL